MKKLLLLLGLLILGTANAETFSEIPVSWILENYDSNGVVFSRTQATCMNGRLILSSTSSVADRDRFFSTVVSAKMKNAKISIVYSVSSNSCIITKFSIDENSGL